MTPADKTVTINLKTIGGVTVIFGYDGSNTREIWIPEVIDQYSPPLIAGLRSCKT